MEIIAPIILVTLLLIVRAALKVKDAKTQVDVILDRFNEEVPRKNQLKKY